MKGRIEFGMGREGEEKGERHVTILSLYRIGMQRGILGARYSKSNNPQRLLLPVVPSPLPTWMNKKNASKVA